MGFDVGTRSSSKGAPMETLTAQQKKVDAAYGAWLQQYIGKGATPYNGQIVADMPTDVNSMFQDMLGSMSANNKTIETAFRQDAEGVPAYAYDERKIKRDWETNVASPVMSAWTKYVAPVVTQAFAGSPGAFYSAAKGQGVANAASKYFAENVQGTLYNTMQNNQQMAFQSGENAAGRRASGASALQSLPISNFNSALQGASSVQGVNQQKLSAAYSEFMRKAPENNPYMQAINNYLGTGMVAIENKSTGGGSYGASWTGM